MKMKKNDIEKRKGKPENKESEMKCAPGKCGGM